MSVLKAILGAPAEAVARYFTRRLEIKAEDRQQERALKRAQVERQVDLIKTGLAADATWELESLKAHADGWKDEFVLVMFAIPYVLSFFPHTAAYVSAGFDAITKMPTWYVVGSMSVFMATYGIRWWRRLQSDT